MMKESIQNIKHILYRLKTLFFHQSLPALCIKSKIWNVPSPGTLEILFREEQNISHYFKWEELDDSVSKNKLIDFTERYAREPNIVYCAKGDIIIEPEFGLAIKQGRQFIPQSGTLSHIFLRPSLIKYLKHFYFNKRYTYYESVIHCDGFAGINLCHFVYDTINPILFLLERGMITKASSVLISEKIFMRPYFQYIISNSPLGELNWVVQKSDEWIKVKSFTKAFVSMEIFKSTYEIFKGIKNPHRKIFLNRRAYFQRNIKNIDRLLIILNRYGFEFIFAEDLSYEDQIKLFRDVKYFVGIHGAGLTNLLNSEIRSICVLEIFSESYVHASFYRFLKILGIKYYDSMAGSKFDLNWNFTIDEKAFELRIQKLIAQ